MEIVTIAAIGLILSISPSCFIMWPVAKYSIDASPACAEKGRILPFRLVKTQAMMLIVKAVMNCAIGMRMSFVIPEYVSCVIAMAVKNQSPDSIGKLFELSQKIARSFSSLNPSIAKKIIAKTRYGISRRLDRWINFVLFGIVNRKPDIKKKSGM